MINNTVNVTLTNMDLTTIGSTDPVYAFRVQDSTNVTFSNLHAHGDATVAPSAQISGFYVTGSKNVIWDHDTIDHMGTGLVANKDDYVTVTNTAFSYLSKGGVEMGGSSDVTVANNTFTNFQVGQGTHPDAIQLYTAGTSASAHDISITYNLIDRGSGDAVQGIFVSDETGVLPYHNVGIQNNVVLGGMWDSLYLDGATGNVQINNNYVASWAGLDKEGNGTDSAALYAPTVTGFAGYVWLQNLTGATLTETGNTAQSFLGNSGAVLATPAGNTLIGQVNPVSATALPLSPVTAVAETAAGNTYGHITGNALTGDTGSGVYLASIQGAGAYTAVTTTGTTVTGKYGNLTVAADGAYTYTPGINGTVGVAYDDHFIMTVGTNGQATSTTLDVILTPSGVGDGQADYMTGGAAASRFSGFGAGSQLTSGVGADTFAFNSIGQSTLANETLIKDFKAGDIIDLTGIATNFKIVSSFDGHANEIELAHMGNGNWQVIGDTTGGKTPTFAIHLLNDTVDLTAANFNLGAGATSSSVPASIPSVAPAAVVAAPTAATVTPAPTVATPPVTVAAPTVVTPTVTAAAPAPTPAVVVAEKFASTGYGVTSGNALAGDSGTGLYLASLGIGSDPARSVSASGSTFTGKYGVLAVSANGAFTYTAGISPTVGVAYDDHFTINVADSSGKTTSTTLDVILTSAGVGDGKADYMFGGAAASTMSAFGAGSELTSGVGATTFAFNSIGQSTLANETKIRMFKPGDIIDLSSIDPAFKIVSKFDGQAHELFLAHMGSGNWQVEGDTLGGGAPTFAIHLLSTTVANLTAANFHL